MGPGTSPNDPTDPSNVSSWRSQLETPETFLGHAIGVSVPARLAQAVFSATASHSAESREASPAEADRNPGRHTTEYETSLHSLARPWS